MVEPLIPESARTAAERLDHGLEFAQQRVDDESGTVSGVVHYDDVLALAGIALYLEYIAQAKQGAAPRREG